MRTQWKRHASRLLTVVVAFLAFGILGPLVMLWRARRGSRRTEQRCRNCRRRRHVTLAASTVLAGLVVTGAGLAVHQSTSEPGMPVCEAQESVQLQGSTDRSPNEADGSAVWAQTRQIVTAPVSGLTRQYVNDRGGGLCEGPSMTFAFLPSAAADSGLAVGGVVLMDVETRVRATDWEALAHHESRHVTQWAGLTLAGGPLAMPLLYAVDDAFFPKSQNHFERAAGLEDGGYPHADGFGPQPDWSSVTVIGLVGLVVFRRRIRWASRVLVGGRRAATARQPGFCPVHSEGWFSVTGGARQPLDRRSGPESHGYGRALQESRPRSPEVGRAAGSPPRRR